MCSLVDAQLPPALARWLEAQGQHAEHVADRQLLAASDQEIWAYALRRSVATVGPTVLKALERGESVVEIV